MQDTESPVSIYNGEDIIMLASSLLLDIIETSGYNPVAESFGKTKKFIFGVPSTATQKDVFEIAEDAKKYVNAHDMMVQSVTMRFLTSQTTSNDFGGFVPPHIIIVDGFSFIKAINS